MAQRHFVASVVEFLGQRDDIRGHVSRHGGKQDWRRQLDESGKASWHGATDSWLGWRCCVVSLANVQRAANDVRWRVPTCVWLAGRCIVAWYSVCRYVLDKLSRQLRSVVESTLSTHGLFNIKNHREMNRLKREMVIIQMMFCKTMGCMIDADTMEDMFPDFGMHDDNIDYELQDIGMHDRCKMAMICCKTLGCMINASGVQ